MLARRDPYPTLQRRSAQAGIVALMVLLYLGWPIVQSNVLGVSAIALATALLLLGGTHPPTSKVILVLAAFGRRSYEIYLFHLLVLGLMRTAMPPALTAGDEKTGLLIAYLMLSGAVGICVARLWSDPLNQVLRRRVIRDPAFAR